MSRPGGLATLRLFGIQHVIYGGGAGLWAILATPPPIPEHQSLGFALAFGMIVVTAIANLIYIWLRIRAERWLK